MRKNSSEYRIWKKKNDYKKLRNRINAKKGKHHYKSNREHKERNLPYKVFTTPKQFSILNNPEETIEFFNGILRVIENIPSIKNSRHVYLLKIDMMEIESVTGDALMYLLTVMKNTKMQKDKRIIWKGNFPKNDKLEKFLKESGFLNYMRTAEQNLIHSDENIEIQSGRFMQGDIAKYICDFTNDKLNKGKLYSKFLYRMLTELMTNTKDHAYNKKSKFDFCWYIFVENTNDKIKYTFMDNGIGIPTTVLKKFRERIIEILNLDKEYKYIESALKGEFRTETKLEHRGTGLPDIYEISKNKSISNLTIISNYAYYSKENSSYDLGTELEGTILYWEIVKTKGDMTYEN